MVFPIEGKVYFQDLYDLCDIFEIVILGFFCVPTSFFYFQISLIFGVMFIWKHFCWFKERFDCHFWDLIVYNSIKILINWMIFISSWLANQHSTQSFFKLFIDLFINLYHGSSFENAKYKIPKYKMGKNVKMHVFPIFTIWYSVFMLS